MRTSTFVKAALFGVIFAMISGGSVSSVWAGSAKETAKNAKTALIEEPFTAEVEKVFQKDGLWCMLLVNRNFSVYLTGMTAVLDERGAPSGIKAAPELLVNRAVEVTMSRDEIGRFVARKLLVLPAAQLEELRRKEAARPPVYRGSKDGRVMTR